MNLHYAEIGLVKVLPSGKKVFSTTSNNATIAEMCRFSTEHRILPNSSNINTNDYPTIEEYLILEAAAGYKPIQILQYLIITVNESASSTGGNNQPITINITLDGSWQALGGDVVGDFELSAPLANANNVSVRSASGIAPYVPGEWHPFVHTKLSDIQVQGTGPDTMTVFGNTV